MCRDTASSCATSGSSLTQVVAHPAQVIKSLGHNWKLVHIAPMPRGLTAMGSQMSIIPWSVTLDLHRLDELRSLNILDTEPEQSYDDLAEIARLICDTSVANVTLVARNRQWLKSTIGNDVQETSIAQSVCAHALDKQDTLVINDLTADGRTRDNTLVTGEASLRFYAGVPLRLDASFGVGTLCVLDTKPHLSGLTPSQTEALRGLGRQATILLQVRRYLATEEKGEEKCLTPGEPLDDICEALLTAYELNKNYNDKVIESLVASTLTHIAVHIARSGKVERLFIH